VEFATAKFDHRREMLSHVDRSHESFIEESADFVLRIPEALLDQVFMVGRKAQPRRDFYSVMRDQDQSLVSQWVTFDRVRTGGTPYLFRQSMLNIVEAEQKFFSRFDESYLNTPGFEQGGEGIDEGALKREQSRLLMDVARKTYSSRYRADRADERVRDDLWSPGRWAGVDFIMLPPLAGVYTYYRGFERKIGIGATRLRIHLEPPRRLRSAWVKEMHVEYAAWAEWEWPGFPIRLLAAAGLDRDREAELDFIGIGTSIGEARKIFTLQED
jgi:hypothetical protein